MSANLVANGTTAIRVGRATGTATTKALARIRALLIIQGEMRMTKWSPFRKIRVWALYDPAARQVNSFHKFKYQVPVPRRGSGLCVVELTGFYPASARETGAEHER